MNSSFVRMGFLALVFTGLPVFAAACSGGDPPTGGGGGGGGGGETTPGTPPSSTGDVTASCATIPVGVDAKCTDGYVFTDGFSDEACETINDNQRGIVMGSAAVNLENAGAKLTASAPATFRWTKGASASRGPLRLILDALIPPAYAHGNPVNGDAFAIVFLDKGCKEVLRAHTKSTSWTADAASWSTLKAAQGPLSVFVIYAKFSQNGLADGTKLQASKPATFSIK